MNEKLIKLCDEVLAASDVRDSSRCEGCLVAAAPILAKALKLFLERMAMSRQQDFGYADVRHRIDARIEAIDAELAALENSIDDRTENEKDMEE